MSLPKILIVDDEPFNIDYLEQELEESKFITLAATDGQEALDQVQAESPDLILLDIMMPIMDGFEVLARLKADPTTRDIPVIIISADNNMHSVVKGIQLGAEDYLPKPFEPTLLHARISSSLVKKNLRDLQKLYLKSLERELEIGRDIQKGFLPAQLPQVDGWQIAAYFKAAREVSGDFYDAYLLPDGNLMCVVGDVCGKGVGAALFMTLFRSLIRATSTTEAFSEVQSAGPLTHAERLAQIISFTNNYVATTHYSASMFATVFIGIIDLSNNTLTYLCCGNEHPVVVSQGGEITTLQTTGPIVGIIPDAPFPAIEIPFNKNNLLLAFSDGLTDALNPDVEAFGRERLLSILKEGDTNPAALISILEERVHQFIGPADQFDDITVLVVKRDA